MWKEKLKAIPKGVGASILAVGTGTALAVGLLAGGGTFASWSSGSQLALDSSIQIDWDDPTPPTITTESLENAFVGDDYSAVIEGDGYGSHSITSGALPDGLRIDERTGRISGKATKKGSYSFTVQKLNKVGEFSKNFTLNVVYSAPTITTENLNVARKGVGYTQLIEGRGGDSFHELSVGTLPPGLSLNAQTGTISGVTTALGVYPITIKKTNESGTTQKSFDLEVKLSEPKFLDGSQLPPGNLNTPYSRKIRTEGEEVTFSSSNLPAWLKLDPTTGTLTGTPPEMITYTFDITVSNSGGLAKQTFSLTVRDTPPTITNSSLVDGEVGVSYTDKLILAESDASFTGASGLPSGLSFSTSTGVISGVPRFSGTFDVTFSATRKNVTGFKTLSIYIETDGPTITTKTLPDATQNENYPSQALAGKGESPTYEIIAGALPPTFGITNNGTIYGSPKDDVYGKYTFTVSKTNIKGVATQELSITVNYQKPTIISWALADARLNTAYTSAAPRGVGNGSTYSIANGVLPSGMTLNTTTGVISGTTSQAGSFPLTLRKENSVGFATFDSVLNVLQEKPVMISSAYPEAVIGKPYYFKVEATGENLVFDITSGSLPPGLTLNATTGEITGKTIDDRRVYITITATNAGGSASFNNLFVSKSEAPTWITTELPKGTIGEPYFGQLEASGGNIAYTINTAGFSLPAGLRLDSATGIISGTPTSLASNPITFQARNTGGLASTRIPVIIETQAPTITSEELPNAIVSTAYSYSITGVGSGNTWTISAGALPKGISLNSTGGRLSGTTTEYGYHTFTVTKTNSAGSVSKEFTLRVMHATPTITNSNTSLSATVGKSFTQSLTGAGTGVTYSIINGSLPEGIAINPTTGVLNGTPTKAGVYTFTVQKANPDESVQKTFTITVS